MDGSARHPKGPRASATVVGAAVLAVGLYALSRHNYLVYHSAIEVLAATVAMSIFCIGWNSRQFSRNDTLLVLSIGYLIVGALDVLHALAYKGMGVFPQGGSNLATQLWIAARYLESATILLSSVVLATGLRIHATKALILYLAAGTGIVVAVIALQAFPVCYVEGIGLTAFKVVSEYVICGLLAVAALVFWRKRAELDRGFLLLILASIGATALSELSFTLYVDVYGFFNFLGHILKLGSVICIYVALVRGSLEHPYEVMFRDIAQSERTLQQEVAQRRQAEESLKQTLDKLQRSNAELEQFAYVASHDLQEPLRMVASYMQLIERRCQDKLDAEASEFIGFAVDGAHRMKRLIDDLLEYSRLSTRADPFEQTDLEVVMRDTLANLRRAIEEAGAVVNHGPLPTVTGAPTQLLQLFQNLIGNAVKFRGEELPLIQVSAVQKGEHWLFFFSDNGIGIDPEYAERIFKIFQRLHGREDYPGTGIGLAVCKKIVERHGGEIWVDSEPGKGATFIFSLPAQGGEEHERKTG